MHGGFNVPNISGTLTSRNSSMNSVASCGVQQPTGNVTGDRFASNNTPIALSQNSMAPDIGLRTMSSPGTFLVWVLMGSSTIRHYQHQQSQPQFGLQQMPCFNPTFRDQGVKSMQSAQATPPVPFGLLGLLSVIRMSDPDLTSLALGIDLTTLGLNLTSSKNLHKMFASPWSDDPAKGEPEFSVPDAK